MSSYFAKQQEGFRKGHGTTQGLIKISQVVQSLIASGDGGVVLALDFAKAFDTVPHNELLKAIKEAKITKSAGKWVESWARGGEFEVKIGDELSSPREVRSGVRQGSCLGPLCFIIYINSLIEALLNVSKIENQSRTYQSLAERCFIQVYADDVTLMVRFPKRTEYGGKEKYHAAYTPKIP